ncbi:protein kinase domain-containing protein [Pyxidicoccus xibeiensis]|uniref:protein kinase domain-containing protein n=1 Tax=Pyxidicoccus xibeiensis TaxID=2906759 RepID=UPI0020A79890|nr:protein kinase [Pyxidicoccus xibeiensis]MCP3140772.1 protein kinase [Pyxidicoccus xibeiensis]
MHASGQKIERYEEELLLALDEGLLSHEELAALREEALRLDRGPLQLLKERGRLSEDTLGMLREELSREQSTQPGVRPVEAATLTPTPPGVTAAPAVAGEPPFPVPDWDRYQPVRFLGQGGMGLVFLAYDPLLRRNVALKFVRDGDAELARRILSEARAQARVRHERVCEVYEVGEVRGRGYIAMRYVDGQTLGQLADTLTLEQKVLVLRQAAEGVHAAHRAGLIHRDIKPGNILVERTEDGGLAPFVMDFGLAREGRDEGVGQSAVLGTPHYMAPEQARGGAARLDRRVDVYALGATLYSLLTGRPPFDGTTAQEVITRLQTEEPRPLRALDANIPEDLEAIVLKCLEKERPARYDSARALVEDLERFLEGEPVQARRGLGYRLRRKARKHRVALAAAAAALTVVTLAVGQAVLARSEVLERERLASRFTERVERIESSARYSALSPLHDTRDDRKALRERMDALETEVHQAGTRAMGPGQYALGRALLALDDARGARERLEAAWNHGYREPRVAWALALVLGDLYREQLLLDVERRGPEQREARRKELEQRYRDPALAYLRQAEGPEVPAPPRYVKALFAFYEGRHEEALAHLDAMGRALPWFYEAPLLRGDILLARATQRWPQGDTAGSKADLDAARQAYATAIATADSQPATHYALGRLELAAFVMELYGEGNVLPHYERGLESLARALAAAPDHAASQVVVSRLHRRLAEQRALKGGADVEALLQKSIDAARAAQAHATPEARVPLELAIAYRQWARHLQGLGKDPSEQLRLSIESFEQLRPEERDYAFHANLGVTYQVWADHEAAHGEDPLAHQEKAIEAYRAAIALRENQADAWINLGKALRSRATTPRAPDTAGDLVRAREALDRALALNPRNIAACFEGAFVSERLAQWKLDHGEDPGPDQEKALALHRQGLSINPRLPQLHNGLGSALLWQAEQRWEEGADPEPLFNAAQQSFEQARAAAPQQAFAYNNLGEVWALRAAVQLARREDPGPSVRAAIESYRKALELLPDDGDLWANLGRVHGLRATWVLEQGGDPSRDLAHAEEALARASERNPRQGSAWRQLGEARGTRARWRARKDMARNEDFEEAAKSFQQALELEPRRLEYRVAAGDMQREWAAWKQRRGEDATPVLKRGLELAEHVLAARPRWARARLLRANVLLALAESPAPIERREAWRKQAQADVELALSANPHLRPAWKSAPAR